MKACDESIYREEQTASSSTDRDDENCITVDRLSDTNAPSSSRQRPRVPGLQRDIEVLKSELLKFISEHGQEGFMPMRKQLRLHGRVDIEKAITHMGGFRRIATLMNLSLAYKHRKPKGYWDNLDNLQEEVGAVIITCAKSLVIEKRKRAQTPWFNRVPFYIQINRFQRSWGMDPSFMPSRKSFERAGKK